MNTHSIRRRETSIERSHRDGNSTALLLSQIGNQYTEELTEARLIRQSGGKDRHCKVVTSRGPRDRRVRLSIPTATQLYEVQDRLGYDQPSKVIEWLIKEAKSAIDELGLVPDLGLKKFKAVDLGLRRHASMMKTNPNQAVPAYRSCRTTDFSRFNKDKSSLEGSTTLRMNSTPKDVRSERILRIDSMDASFAHQEQERKPEEQLSFGDPPYLNPMFTGAMSCWTSWANGTKDRVPSFEEAEVQQIEKAAKMEKAAEMGSSVELCREAWPDMQSTWIYSPLKDKGLCASPSCAQKEASYFDREPLEQATTYRSASSSSSETLQSHKTSVSQRLPQFQFHQGPFQRSFPSARALEIHSSVTTVQSTFSTINPIPPPHSPLSWPVASLSENDVQINANIIVPSQNPGSNIVSPPVVHSIRSVPVPDDEYKSNIALPKSLAVFSQDVGAPINDRSWRKDQITKFAPSSQDYQLLTSLLDAGGSLDQEDLLLEGYARGEGMVSSISSPIPNPSEGFVSFALTCSSTGSLQSNQNNPVESRGMSTTGMCWQPETDDFKD